MEDKNLPQEQLPADATADSDPTAKRRAFLKRAALVGIPVLIASVPGRVAWANNTGDGGGISATCGGSLSASSWNPDC